jgi:hypothetical protein
MTPRRPIDLSIPPPLHKGQPSTIPSFRRQYRAITTAQTVAASINLFNPEAACTVQWVLLQVATACTAQLTLNNQPFGLALVLPAGSVVRFAGTLVANNEVLGLTVSVPTVLSAEVVWIKEFHPDFIVETAVSFGSSSGSLSPVNVTEWNSIALSSPDTTAPAGTESAIVTRNILRKATTIETTTNLAANGVFTGNWHDSNGDGTMQVVSTVFTNQISASNGFILQESDDITNANLTRLVIGYSSTIPASTLSRIIGIIKARYWRVQFTNGVTAQGSMELTTTAFNILTPTYERTNANQLSTAYDETISAVMTSGPLALTDATVNDANLLINLNNTAYPGQSCEMAFNGSVWDRRRNNQNVTTGDTGTKTASFNGATQTSYEGLGALITALLGTVSGTTPTLAIQLQWSPDGSGTTWLNIGPAMTALTATGQTGLIAIFPANLSQSAGAAPAVLTTGATQQVILNCPLPRTWRLVYTIGGTTPSFALTAVYVNYMKA